MLGCAPFEDAAARGDKEAAELQKLAADRNEQTIFRRWPLQQLRKEFGIVPTLIYPGAKVSMAAAPAQPRPGRADLIRLKQLLGKSSHGTQLLEVLHGDHPLAPGLVDCELQAH